MLLRTRSAHRHVAIQTLSSRSDLFFFADLAICCGQAILLDGLVIVARVLVQHFNDIFKFFVGFILGVEKRSAVFEDELASIF